jgi:hypothetical protein
MIQDWIDTLTKVWEVSDGEGGQVQAYRLFERDEFPENIPLDRPTALTFVDSVDFDYSTGGPAIAIWRGTVEFSLTPDNSKMRIPKVIMYFGRIMSAAAANMTLGGRVNYMVIDPNSSIEMVVRSYGNAGQEHLGLVVKWIVKEHIQGLTVS